MVTFKELGLGQEILDVLDAAGINTPTEIQEKTIPLLLQGHDVIGGSATGSGKTLAFASPIIQKMEKGNYPKAIILTPTRELAEQVATSIENFSKNKKLNVLSIYGGVSIERQIQKLHNADIIVGTPGRIIDHINRGTLRLHKIEYLVLDEVDRMFDMGFRFDVERIINECPKKRQTMLFSATISADMDYLAKKYTNNAKEVHAESHVDTTKLKQVYYNAEMSQKFSLLVHLLKKEKTELVIVFCNTRRNVDFITPNLQSQAIKAGAIHGKMPQNKRMAVLRAFQEEGIHVLVCTDVAARGLDIKGVSHIYNYDIPSTKDEYIHRIGRTARAGMQGIAISILCGRDYENFGRILNDKSIKVEEKETPRFEFLRVRMIDTMGQQGHFQKSRFNRNPSRSRGRDYRGKDQNRNDQRSYGRGPRQQSMNAIAR